MPTEPVEDERQNEESLYTTAVCLKNYVRWQMYDDATASASSSDSRSIVTQSSNSTTAAALCIHTRAEIIILVAQYCRYSMVR